MTELILGATTILGTAGMFIIGISAIKQIDRRDTIIRAQSGTISALAGQIHALGADVDWPKEVYDTPILVDDRPKAAKTTIPRNFGGAGSRKAERKGRQ